MARGSTGGSCQSLFLAPIKAAYSSEGGSSEGGSSGGSGGGNCQLFVPCPRRATLRAGSAGSAAAVESVAAKGLAGSAGAVETAAATASAGAAGVAGSTTSTPSTPSTPELSPVCVWVRRLPWTASREEVVQALQQACKGKVEVHVDGPKRKQRGPAAAADHRGHAFLLFKDREEAQSALQQLTIQPLTLGGQQCVCEVSLAPIQLLPQDWHVRASLGTAREEDVLAQAGKGARRSKSVDERRAHLQRNRQARLRARVQALEQALQLLPPPGGLGALNAYQPICPATTAAADDSRPAVVIQSDTRTDIQAKVQADVQAGIQAGEGCWAIDWEAMPQTCQVQEAGTKGNSAVVTVRVQRKRAQVESFLLVLQQLMPQLRHRGTTPPPPSPVGPQPYPLKLRVVEFGSGSGNLLLPLAWALPGCSFHAVDIKQAAVQLLLQRAQAAGLQNVTASVGRIEEFSGSFDVALALHACGAATDYAMLQAHRQQAAFICSPCCIGKIRRGAFVAPGERPQGRVQMAVQDAGGADGLTGQRLQKGVQMAVQDAGAACGATAQRLHEEVREAGGVGERLPESAQAAVQEAEVAGQSGGIGEHMKESEAGLHSEAAADGDWDLQHPRSRWMTAALGVDAAEVYLELARAADISHGGEREADISGRGERAADVSSGMEKRADVSHGGEGEEDITRKGRDIGGRDISHGGEGEDPGAEGSGFRADDGASGMATATGGVEGVWQLQAALLLSSQSRGRESSALAVDGVTTSRAGSGSSSGRGSSSGDSGSGVSEGRSSDTSSKSHPEGSASSGGATSRGNGGGTASQGGSRDAASQELSRVSSDSASQGVSVRGLRPPQGQSQDEGVTSSSPSHDGHSHAELALLAKCNLEMDRLMSMRERGYVTALTRLLQPHLLPTKADLMVGVPESRVTTPTAAMAAQGQPLGPSLQDEELEAEGQRFLSEPGALQFEWPWQQ